MITTAAAGRVWHFQYSLGRPTNEVNGRTGGYRNPVDLAIAHQDPAKDKEIIFVLSRGGTGGDIADCGRVGKTTLGEDHIGDFARKEFVWPVGIAVGKDGTVWVSDEGLNCVMSFSPDGIIPYPDSNPGKEHVAMWGDRGAAPGLMDGPAGIVFDKNDDLYVVDSRNHRVQKFTREGKHLLTFGSHGTGPGQLSLPWGITIDRKGDVYVADWGNNRVQKFTADGKHLMAFGTIPESGGELDHPAGVAVDADGDVYVTDWGNKRVQIYEPNGDIIAALYGDATTLSKAGEYIIRRDPGTIKAYRQVKDYTGMGRFQRPTGIRVDDAYRIIVTDNCGRLQVYQKDKEYVHPGVKLEIEQ
ncbi:MAG: hypothetical protein FJ319_03275 [SAR202 cluster bacterium]|nr:hypothetical protein [SAR202 cluster bacterium]